MVPWWSGRFTDDETRCELDVQRLEPPAFEQLHQETQGCAPHLGERLPDRRQLGGDDRGVSDVVETDDGETVRNPSARGLKDADPEVVVEGEDRRGRIGKAQPDVSRGATGELLGSHPMTRGAGDTAWRADEES